MKTVIIGTGAMGSLFGGLLTEAGADVCLKGACGDPGTAEKQSSGVRY